MFPHQVDLYLMKITVTRWCDIERAVRNKENLDLLHKFRLSIKIICNTLGCDICIPPLPLLHTQAHEKAAMRTAREPMRTAAERKDCPKGRALGELFYLTLHHYSTPQTDIFMKNILLRFLVLLILVFNIFLCSKHSNVLGVRQSGDTIWNDSVQDTFYDATFGDSIPIVKEKLEAHGFRFVSHGSDEESLCFMPKNDKIFEFNNMIWQTLYIQSSKDHKFIGILFLSAFYDKDGALSFYDDLNSYLRYKYDN